MRCFRELRYDCTKTSSFCHNSVNSRSPVKNIAHLKSYSAKSVIIMSVLSPTKSRVMDSLIDELLKLNKQSRS